MESLPDIPKLYTALAEWLACVSYILIMRKRLGRSQLILMGVLSLLVQIGINLGAGIMHPLFWLGWMTMAFLGMYFFIWLGGKVSPGEAGFITIRAFIAAEFAASLHWQIYIFLAQSGRGGQMMSTVTLILIYAGVFGILYVVEKEQFKNPGRLQIGMRELWVSILIGGSVFLMSNLSFVYQNTPFSGSMPEEIFYIRSLVDLIGIVLLHTQLKQLYETKLQQELENMDSLFRRQYTQYQMSKENDEIIRRTYHDLKHQINEIRNESDAGKQSEYLAEMEQAIRKHEAENKTGNSVLDTLLFGKGLYCTEHDINLTCIADGSLLEFMEVMDICSIFGNALDNALEYVSKLPREKRLVSMSVKAQNEFVIIGFDNYYEDVLELEDGLPVTTKENTEYHGYGLKSIRKLVEKYEGTLTLHGEDSWFRLRMLFPRQKMH